MQIVHFICDRCHRHEIEDDVLDWTQTKDGRDLCPGCVFPFPRIPERSMWEGPLVVTRPGGSE
ncbi:hypothetical protein CXR34_04270 [Microbacterium hominis]|uniref:Uncharacterized protein n=1 Tax=Microbacterium hominis TaxID=162426 RepID=A0A2K9DVU0_9MICO|nr:hypothetical protein CXR34_04270 [Microbacterium hominis]